MAKNYSTTSSLNDTCIFRRDYSYYVNYKCLDCKFCYRYASEDKGPRRSSASLIRFEEESAPWIYKVPITVSRYCDPLCTPGATRNSLFFSRYVLERGGKVIFRSAKVFDDERFYDILSKHSKSIMYQPRVIFDSSTTSKVSQKIIAPNFDDFDDMMKFSEKVISYNVESAVYFDPIIIGLNNTSVHSVIEKIKDIGINKIIVRQLFATTYFKNWLAINVSKRFSSMLKNRIGSYYTYDNELLLYYLEPIVSAADKNNVSISVCGNKALNKIIKNDINCCQFDGAGFYYKGFSLGPRKVPEIGDFNELTMDRCD
jgi:DNA repair photolyase